MLLYQGSYSWEVAATQGRCILTGVTSLRRVDYKMSIVGWTKNRLLALVGRRPKMPTEPAERREMFGKWLDEHPELAESVDRGIRDMREGRYVKLSRPDAVDSTSPTP
jgi:hypothetical protein